MTTRYLRVFREMPEKAAVAVLMALLFAVLGPFGEYQAEPFTARIFNWILDMGVGSLIFLFVWYRVNQTAHLARLHFWARIVIAALVGSMPMVVFMSFTEALAGRAVPIAVQDLAAQYGQVILIAVFVLTIFALLERRQKPASVPAQANAATVPSPGIGPRIPFLERLPESIGCQLLYLKMEDHYVRVQTKKGETLIHMRFRDAVSELQGAEGFQPHRSWWVAADAIKSVSKKSGNVVILLADDTEIPVARRRVQQLRSAGWID